MPKELPAKPEAKNNKALAEETVCRNVLQSTIQDIRAHNADADPDEIQRIVDEVVDEVRAAKQF